MHQDFNSYKDFNSLLFKTKYHRLSTILELYINPEGAQGVLFYYLDFCSGKVYVSSIVYALLYGITCLHITC